MKMNRKTAKVLRISSCSEPADSYVKATRQERVAAMWEITAELWSLTGKCNVKRRLQRNVTRLYRQQG